eukprot:SAG31_NODE_18398_length_638_cov_0.740260_1_plen_56_part_10
MDLAAPPALDSHRGLSETHTHVRTCGLARAAAIPPRGSPGGVQQLRPRVRPRSLCC